MFSVLNKCDPNDPNIPQEVKDFCEQVNRDFWPMDCNPFNILVSEHNSSCYSLSFSLENTCIYVDNFGTTDIKDATVGVSYEDRPRQRIYASIGNVPRDEVGKKAADFFNWVGKLVDNPDMDFLEIMNCT